MTDPRQDAAPTGYVLWFRASRRERWRAVGRGDTEAGCTDLMAASGLRNGQWLTTPAGVDPNAKARPR